MNFLSDGEIILRAIDPEDSEAMLEFENDSTHWRSNGMCAPYSQKIIREYAEGYDADPFRSGQLRMIIDVKKEIIGLLDLYEISAQNRTAFIGIYIKDSSRKKGYATKCLQLVEDYARQLLNLRILGAKISCENIESLRLFEDSGYIETGRLPDWLLRGKERFDLLIFTKSIET